MRHRTICQLGYTTNLERSAAVAYGQPGDLRADWNAAHDYCYANSSYRNLIDEFGFSIQL